MFENSQTLTLLVSVSLVRRAELPWERGQLAAPGRRGESILKWDFLVSPPQPPAHFPDDTSYFPYIGTPFILKDVRIHPARWVPPLSRCGEGGEAGAGRPWYHPDSQNRHFHLLQAAEALLSPPACRLFRIAIRQLWGRSSRINSGE